MIWRALAIASVYGEILEKTSKKPIVPESLLPFSKERIRLNIKLLLFSLRNKVVSNELRKMCIPKDIAEFFGETPSEFVEYALTDEFYYESLKVGYVSLAKFVPDNDAQVFEKWWELVEQPSEQLAEQLSTFFDLGGKAVEILRRSEDESNALYEELRKNGMISEKVHQYVAQLSHKELQEEIKRTIGEFKSQ